MIIGKYRVEIDKDLSMNVWAATDGADVLPFLFQPHYPDGKPFENEEAAINWVTEYLKSIDKFIAENPPVEESTNP